MILATFIRKNSHKIIGEWNNFARSLLPAATDMTPLALRDHIKEILEFIVTDMERPQTGVEQIEKSQGEGKQNQGRKPSAAETHAALRLSSGFDLDQMVSEYRALRASVIKLWGEARREGEASKGTEEAAGAVDLLELTRFNEAIDQALTESVRHYAKKLGASKDLFLGILTHDLRNPLGAMLGAADLIPRIDPLSEKQNVLISQIIESGSRISEIISHLLDITKARFGSGLPVIRSPMDMGFVARQLVDEVRLMHPGRKFALEVSGTTEGNWDKARIGQVFSNLLGNAVQYSFQDTYIDVTVRGTPQDVVLTVHNKGTPIPPDKIAGIFDSLVRATAEDKEHHKQGTTNLGLGLYITKEIVTAHGGELGVTSTEKNGTTFTASFPREEKASHEKDKNPGLPVAPDNAGNANPGKSIH